MTYYKLQQLEELEDTLDRSTEIKLDVRDTFWVRAYLVVTENEISNNTATQFIQAVLATFTQADGNEFESFTLDTIVCDVWKESHFLACYLTDCVGFHHLLTVNIPTKEVTLQLAKIYQ